MKNPFKKEAKKPEKFTIDELIVLERFDEAHDALRKRLKGRPRDNHARLRLAEVLGAMGRGGDSLTQFREVATAYAEDGFLDKALAVVTKALRLAPNDTALVKTQYSIQQMIAMRETKTLAVSALRERLSERSGEINLANVNIEVENLWAGLSGSKVVQAIPKDQLLPLLKAADVVTVEAGKPVTLVRKTEPLIFITVMGELEARNEKHQVLRNLQRGDIFGDSTLLQHQPWLVNIVAIKRTTLMRIDRAGLETAMTGNPDPKALLDFLRHQQNDAAIRKFFEKT